MLTSRIFKNLKKFNIFSIRYKHKENHWAVQNKKKSSTEKALKHFDEFYKSVYKTQWPFIRTALLGKQKYVAIVNNYGDKDETCKQLELRGAINIRKVFDFQEELLAEKTQKAKRQEQLERIWKMEKEMDDVQNINPSNSEVDEKPDFSLNASLKNAEYDSSRIIQGTDAISSSALHEFIPATKIKGREDFIPESDYYKFYNLQNTNFKVKIEKEYSLNFPKTLDVYSYEEESFVEFPKPEKSSTNVLSYYLMDGGSILPVLALDLQAGNRMLDMCSAPGGKSLIALQTLIPDFVVCNDVSISRTNRISKVMNEYLFDFEERWLKPGKVTITCQDGRYVSDEEYDRILVDVPCTVDRHSVTEDDNNIFRADRIKERLKLPELQCELLFNALKLVSITGIVVYSTCSLSPVQNDGVVHMALKRIWEETKQEIVVKNLTPALEQVKDIYKLAPPKLLKYGHLVLPYSVQNFGPTYFCKLQRIR